MCQSELEELLESDLDDPICAISYSKIFEDGLNPCLRLALIGPVGLPLSDRDAAAIKEHAPQPLEAAMRGIWEIDGVLVRHVILACCSTLTTYISLCEVEFKNLRWKSFEDSMIKSACRALDICDFNMQHKLDKLVLCEAGSQSVILLSFIDSVTHDRKVSCSKQSTDHYMST